MSCFRFIAAEKTTYPVSLMCRVLGVSRSGFHAWERRAPSERALVDARLSERIREIYARSRDSYGARRIYLDLRDEDVRVGRKRVERLMRAAVICWRRNGVALESQVGEGDSAIMWSAPAWRTRCKSLSLSWRRRGGSVR